MKVVFDSRLKSIIRGCANGDKDAQAKLYPLYADMLFGVCLRYVRNQPDAEDVLQDTFMRVYRGINNYQGNGSFEGWLKTTCVRTALRFLERKQKLRGDVELSETSEVEDNKFPDALSNLTVSELMKEVMALPTGYRVVFNLYAIEGYKHKEIAEMLDISVGTSKSQLARARQMLKDRILILNKVENTNQKNVG